MTTRNKPGPTDLKLRQEGSGTSALEMRRQIGRASRPLTVDAFRERVVTILQNETTRDEDGQVDSVYGLVYTAPDGQTFSISPSEIGRQPGKYALTRTVIHRPGEEPVEDIVVECDTGFLRPNGMSDPMRSSSPIEATLVQGVSQLTGAWDSILARHAVESTQAYDRERSLREENDGLRKRVFELETQKSGLSNPETLEKLVPIAMKGLDTFVRIRSGEDAIIDRFLGRLTAETRAKVCDELEAWDLAEMQRRPPPNAPTNGASPPAAPIAEGTIPTH